MFTRRLSEKFRYYFPSYNLPAERVSRFLYIQSLLALSSVFPFAILRFYQQEWLQATIDVAIVVIIMGLAFTSKKNDRSAGYVAWIAAFSYIIAVWFVVANFASYTMLWAFPVIVALYFILSPRNAFFTNVIFLIGIWLFIADRPSMHEMVTYSFVVLLVNIFTLQFSSRLYRDNQDLVVLSTLDPLTRVGNRRSLNERLHELSEQKNAGCLLMLDLDHFKQVNDRFGHTIGDKFLQEVVDLIKSFDCHTAEVYRFGGEEFCLIIDKPIDAAFDWAQRLCEVIEIEFTHALQPVTVSIGLVEMKPQTGSAYWLRAADEALYAAKQSGRNQVKLHLAGQVQSHL